MIVKVSDGDRFEVGDVKITIKSVGPKKVHVYIEAPPDVKIKWPERKTKTTQVVKVKQL